MLPCRGMVIMVIMVAGRIAPPPVTPVMPMGCRMPVSFSADNAAKPPCGLSSWSGAGPALACNGSADLLPLA